jgi:hypothetical protein
MDDYNDSNDILNADNLKKMLGDLDNIKPVDPQHVNSRPSLVQLRNHLVDQTQIERELENATVKKTKKKPVHEFLISQVGLALMSFFGSGIFLVLVNPPFVQRKRNDPLCAEKTD